MTEMAPAASTPRRPTSQIILISVAAILLGVALMAFVYVAGTARASSDLKSCTPECEPPAKIAAGLSFLFLDLPAAYLVGVGIITAGIGAAFAGSGRASPAVLTVMGTAVLGAAVSIGLFVLVVKQDSAIDEGIGVVWLGSLVVGPIVAGLSGVIAGLGSD